MTKNLLLFVFLSFLSLHMLGQETENGKKIRQADHVYAIKIDPAQFYYGEFSLSYEHHLLKKCSFEAELGLVGYDYRNPPPKMPPIGGLGSFAVRFYRSKAKTLNHFYLSPKLKYRRYNKVFTNYAGNREIGGSNELILTGNLGYQQWFGKFSLDAYAGIGIGYYRVVSYHDSYDAMANPTYINHFPFFRRIENSGGLVPVFGLKIGFGK